MMHAALQFTLIAASFIGLTTNGFAVAVNLWSWKYKGDLNASDYYICSIALSNLCHQLSLGFVWLCENGWKNETFCQINFILNIISTHFSIAVAGNLCMLYCFKIVAIKHWLLQWYIRRYLESQKSIIFRLFILCMVVGLPLFWIKKRGPTATSDSSLVNMSSFSNLHDMQVAAYLEIYKIGVVTFGYTLPSLLGLLSASCITISLVKHMRRMRGSMEKNNGTLIEAHRHAAVTVLSLLGLILMHFLTSVITSLEVFPKQDLRTVLCKVISSFYTPLLGTLFVRRNSRLRSAASRIGRKVIGMFKENCFS